MEEQVKYRVYKISVNLFWNRVYRDSKVYEIKPGKSTILPGLKYSLLTLLFGWWANPLFIIKAAGNNLRALHINFSGGEDYTKAVVEMNYHPQTIHIYNNLTRETLAEVNIEDIDAMVELQDDYSENNNKLYDQKNVAHLVDNMLLLHIHLSVRTINEFFEASKGFEDLNNLK